MNNKLFAQFAEEAKDVKGGTLAMLWLMVYYSNARAECWPRTRKLARHLHTSERYAKILLRRLIKLGYVRELQPGTTVSPPLYKLCLPEADETQFVSAPLHKNVRVVAQDVAGTDTKRVPAQAGTNINLNKEHKDYHVKALPQSLKQERKEYDPSTMVPCAKPGCNCMTLDGWCSDHRPVGFYSKKMRR